MLATSAAKDTFLNTGIGGLGQESSCVSCSSDWTVRMCEMVSLGIDPTGFESTELLGLKESVLDLGVTPSVSVFFTVSEDQVQHSLKPTS